MTTQELKDELKRRETKHDIKVGATTVALNLDDMQEVFDQIFVHLTPPKPELTVFDIFNDAMKNLNK